MNKEYIKCPYCGKILDSINICIDNVTVDFNYKINKNFEMKMWSENMNDMYFDDSTYITEFIYCGHCDKPLPDEIRDKILKANEGKITWD